VLVLFVVWQARNRREPLVPLRLFCDRNFSLSNLGITTMGFAITAMAFPVMLHAQLVRGLSATQSALLLVPMVLLGIGNAAVWSPLSATATRNLAPQLAGAGAGVYNATRQVGAVLGSAAIAVLMDSRIAAHGLSFRPGQADGGGAMPAAALDAFSKAMADSLLLPPLALLLGLLGVLFFEHPHRTRAGRRPPCPWRPPLWSDRRAGASRPGPTRATGRRQADSDVPVLDRFSHAVTTRSAIPASAALPQARGS